MASSADIIHSEDRREFTDRAGTKDEHTEREDTLSREKAHAKYNFTRARNKLSSLWGGQELPSRRTIQDAYSSLYTCMEPASVAQLDAPSDWRPGGRGFNPRRGRQHSFVEIDHEIFSTVILSLPLIQEGQLSVSGERMCTILVNRLED